MINFECDKIIILHYEMGSGGRFLTNSLGLSENCTFTSSKLSEMQLNGKFNSTKKLNYLNLALKNTNKEWKDLYLSDKEWTGIDYDIYFHFDEDELRKFQYNNIFSNLTKENKKLLFLNTHSNHELAILLKVWKNAKVISFRNTKLFLLIRRFKSDYNLFLNIWNLIPNKNLPNFPYSKNHFYNMNYEVLETVSNYLKDLQFMESLKKTLNSNNDLNKNAPKSFNEYKKLSKEKQKILKTKHKNNEFVIKNSFFIWDVNWYFEKNECIENLKLLYDKLDLKDYNKNYLELYYNNWITKLDNINQ